MGLDSRGTAGYTQSRYDWVYSVKQRLDLQSRNAWGNTVEERPGLHTRGTPRVTPSRNAWIYTVEERQGKSWNARVYTVAERGGLLSSGTRGFT